MKTAHSSFPTVGQGPHLLGLLWLLAALLLLPAGPAHAQFPATASQTLFACNAPGNQFGVQAFADGTGGAYSVWIDKRAGNNAGPGTALYAQHLTAAGVPLLAANGQRLFQTAGKDIFGVKAVPWQSGMLVAWVQGGFGIGGDTVRCQYYDATGAPQWAQPTVVAARTVAAGVIYVSPDALNVLPTDSGATITHALAVGGGGDRLTFNRVSFAGKRRYANNQFQLALPFSSYYVTTSDGGNGFYVVGGSGGLGSALYAQHYDLFGTAWATGVDLTATGAKGRGNSLWRVARDPANNLYAVWGSDSGDVFAVKVTPAGALGWAAPGYRTLSTNPSRQSSPDAIWHNNALWVIWDDDLTPASFLSQYLQKVDAAGALAWPATGVLVNSLPGVYTYPKLAPSDNGAVMAFYSTAYGEGFRAQKIRPDASLAFAVNGVPLHNVVVDQPYVLDYVPVAQPNGSVQVFWASSGAAATGQDICAGRVQSTGTLLGTAERAAVALGFEVYPNPATAELRLRLPAGPAPTGLRLFDAQGRQVRAFAGAAAALPLWGLPAGLYVLRATLAGREVSRRVVVVGE
ncbi:T9SS type A sorting domain-containing protein [Hymenobacter sp.]|uniref:T9SS type A sorting domain-containing protein n=1 Tax=Hymenobacter sp. TaxID=1898978 RepID=UPI00286BE6AA|nr:T9SS type A sorting domain-containing protein [Hymenobacter sp.]